MSDDEKADEAGNNSRMRAAIRSAVQRQPTPELRVLAAEFIMDAALASLTPEEVHAYRHKLAGDAKARS